MSDIRKKLEGSGISLSGILEKAQSLMCDLDGRGRVHAEMPDEKTLGYYSLMGVFLPSVFGIDGFKDEILNKAET